MQTVKIECRCGQHYAFDVEPIGDRLPAPVSCPACGADGTTAANRILAGRKEAAPSLLPRTFAQERDAESDTGLRRDRVPLPWPPLNENSVRDLLNARQDVKRAMCAAWIVAGLDLLLWLLNLFGIKVLNVDRWILVDVVFVAGLAFGIGRFSRVCAVIMCIYYTAGTFYAARFGLGVFGWIIRVTLLFFFLRGAQGAFTHRKMVRRGG